MNALKSISLSAPKINSNYIATPATITTSTVSQGSSPSNYIIENTAVSSSNQMFFDQTYTMLELHMLGDLSPLEPINQPSDSPHKRKSKSVASNLNSRKSHSISSVKTNFINISQTISEADEDFSIKSPQSILDSSDFPFVQLQAPPLNRHKKRRERCKHENEEQSSEVVEGEIKRYNLKNRFGVICYNQQKVNVYEDDLILSGTNIKKFKDMVKKKVKILVEFQLKKVLEEGVEKFRPYNILIKA